MTVVRTILVLCAMNILLTMTDSPVVAGDQQSSTTDKVLRDTKEALEATKQYTLQQKEAFEKTVQIELNELQHQDRGAPKEDKRRLRGSPEGHAEGHSGS